MRKYDKEWYVNKKIDWSFYTVKQKEEVIKHIKSVGFRSELNTLQKRCNFFCTDYSITYSGSEGREYFDSNPKTELLPKDLFNNIQSKLK